MPAKRCALKRTNEGIIIEIKVQHNYELEREILGFGEAMKVIGPQGFRKKIKFRLLEAAEGY